VPAQAKTEEGEEGEEAVSSKRENQSAAQYRDDAGPESSKAFVLPQ
jgi:hypothetical protein